MNVAAVEMVIDFFHHLSDAEAIHIIHLRQIMVKLDVDGELDDLQRFRGYHRSFPNGTFLEALTVKALIPSSLIKCFSGVSRSRRPMYTRSFGTIHALNHCIEG